LPWDLAGLLEATGVEMPPESYVYFGAGGPHERRPVRTPGGPDGFEPISQRSGGTLQTGDQFKIGVPLPPTQLVNRVTYNFAFVNASGGTPSGAQVTFDSTAKLAPISWNTDPLRRR